MRMLPNSGLLKICNSFKSFTPFNKMSSLCHAIAAQITAFLLSAMPMHPKQNLAAANRYGAPLFLRKSHQRFSLPFLRLALLHRAFASRCRAMPCSASPCSAFASQNIALPRLAFALPVCASQCRCNAVGRSTLPLHSSSPHSLCLAGLSNAIALLLKSVPCDAFAHLLKSRQCRCNANHCCAAQSHRTANRTQPCHCFALPISAPHGRAEPLRCGAMRTMPFLRESGPSMPCPCSQAFTS